jgi:hypothetical protein
LGDRQSSNTWYRSRPPAAMEEQQLAIPCHVGWMWPGSMSEYGLAGGVAGALAVSRLLTGYIYGITSAHLCCSLYCDDTRCTTRLPDTGTSRISSRSDDHAPHGMRRQPVLRVSRSGGKSVFGETG